MNGKLSSADRKVDEALEILRAIGFPLASKTPKMQCRLARILLAVCDVRPDTPWPEAKVWPGKTSYSIQSKQIVGFINEHYGEKIKEGSYDDIRRKNLDYLVEAGLVLKSAARPDANTNDGTRGYAASPSAEKLLCEFSKPDWDKLVAEFIANHGSLGSILERTRKQNKITVTLPDGVEVKLAAGKHNDLQKAIVEEFCARFIEEPELLYIGDASQKEIYKNTDRLKEIDFFEIAHDQLPDVIIFDRKRRWLFLIEAVYTANPMSKLRHRILEKAAAACTVDIVYVSAFKDRKAFRKWVLDISWETEVWLVESPDHMIHFNGDKFLGPHSSRSSDSV